MNKIESYIHERTLILEKALVFHINNQIKQHFSTKEEFVEYYNNCNNKQFNKKINNAFSIPSNVINNIIGTPRDENGKQKKVFQKVKTNLLIRGNIIILKHFHEHYTKSPKKYTTVDRYLINPDKINDVLFDDVKISDINSGYYTDKEKRTINNYILHPKEYLTDFKNKKNKSTQIETKEQTTKDEIEMNIIETEINNTKPDTQNFDIINEKLNSIIKEMLELKSQNELLKKELAEIKTSILNHTVTKVEEKKDITTQNKEVEDDIIDEINEDNTSKTLPKQIVLDHTTKNSVKESKKTVKDFNGKDRDTFITNLRAAYASSKISYIDYVNFLIVLGYPQDRLPKIPDEFKNKIRVSKYFNAFYDCLKSRGYNLFGITRMPEQ